MEPKFEGSEVGAMFHMLSKIWKNPIIVTILFAEVFESVLSSGVSAFGLKYLEIEFYLTPIEAGLFSGICSVVGAVLGTQFYIFLSNELIFILKLGCGKLEKNVETHIKMVSDRFLGFIIISNNCFPILPFSGQTTLINF